MKITIKDKEYTIKPDFKTFRLLSEHWGLPNVQSVFIEFQNIAGKEIDCFVDFLGCALKAVTDDDINKDDVGNWIFEDFHGNTKKIEDLIRAALEKQEPEATGNAAALTETEAQLISQNP